MWHIFLIGNDITCASGVGMSCARYYCMEYVLHMVYMLTSIEYATTDTHHFFDSEREMLSSNQHIGWAQQGQLN